jgi:hypothetical protein
MVLIKRIFLLFLAFLVFNMYIPKVFFEQGSICYAKATLTEHPLEVRSSADKRIPVGKKEAKKGKSWLWALLGVVAIGGAVAAAGGSSSSGGGGGDNTGSVGGSW